MRSKTVGLHNERCCVDECIPLLYVYGVCVCVCVYMYVHWLINCVYLCVHMYMPYAVMIGCCVLTVNARVRRSKEEDTASE